VEGYMRALFGTLIAVILLGLYAAAVVFAISVARCLATPGCSSLTAESFTTGFTLVLSTVGGLVSALVIAELAITEPGKAPGARLLPATPSPRMTSALTAITAGYLLIWLAAGLAAFVSGTLLYPGKLQPLTDLGQAWLGLGVAAGYSYFGIKPA
jgi:hypothetical protein